MSAHFSTSTSAAAASSVVHSYLDGDETRAIEVFSTMEQAEQFILAYGSDEHVAELRTRNAEDKRNMMITMLLCGDEFPE